MNDADRVRNGAVEALRAASGLSLVVFPEKELRARLPEGRRLADLTPEELTELEESATNLTVTEGVIEPDGDSWLVQQTGPAWAEADEASADLCGIVFTRLDGSAERHAVTGRPPGPLPAADELGQLLEAALRGDALADEAEDDVTEDAEATGENSD